VLLASVALAAACLACQPEPQLDDFGAAPQFNLTDQTGATFSSASLAGHATLLDFIYTHCTDACPVLSATFQDTSRKLADAKLLGNKVMLVSLSVDPTHDTPEVLAEYGQQFSADPATWKFLTGDWDSVWDAVTGFRVATRPPRPALDAPAPGGTELSHTTRIVLLDPRLQVRAYLDGDGASADDLVAAARRALR
jgi:protein SCO1/2